MYEPLAKSEVLYAGQPAALVVAETEAAAEDGAERVEVELEPLTPVLDLEAATRPGAPLAKTTTEETAPDDEAGSDLTDARASVTAAELGGTAQGLGWALLEELVHDEHGQLSPARSSTTRCRRAGSPRRSRRSWSRSPSRRARSAPRGFGEAPVVAAPAAVANAVAAAAGGVRMRRLPMTPERVWAALRNANGNR
jgi:CO/xanthine dehydrogenase Mo-binding subunit